MKKLIECVPNFSEGNDIQLIKLITNEIEAVEGVIDAEELDVKVCNIKLSIQV